MGKRKGGSSGSGGGKSKKFKVGGFIDPYTSGVYATCNRGREQGCRKELMNLFSEKIEEYFDLDAPVEAEDETENGEDAEGGENAKEELSIEDQIKKELGELKDATLSKRELLTPIDLGCECLVFIKTRLPVRPETLVQKIVEEAATSRQKTTRYTQRLTPITFSSSATTEELLKLSRRVLKPHFHRENGEQQPLKFAIQVSKRNFNALPKPEIIKRIAECVGRDHGHSVDLKHYDKLIMVECYKSNIGMSVVDKYEEYEKFNLQQIFDKQAEGSEQDGAGKSVSRVKNAHAGTAVKPTETGAGEIPEAAAPLKAAETPEAAESTETAESPESAAPADAESA